MHPIPFLSERAASESELGLVHELHDLLSSSSYISERGRMFHFLLDTASVQGKEEINQLIKWLGIKPVATVTFAVRFRR